MKKIPVGISVGLGAAILDTVPMIIQGLAGCAILSAFIMWVVTGFFISISNIKLPPMLKGIVIALLVLAPSAPIIGAADYNVLFVPILPMTLVLGAFSGWMIERLSKKES